MKLEDYTKEEILIAIKKLWKIEERLLIELPLIRYNIMCDKAKEISEQGSEAMAKDNIKESMRFFGESNKLFKDANKFLDGIRKEI
jgi:hypothetical protein